MDLLRQGQDLLRDLKELLVLPLFLLHDLPLVFGERLALRVSAVLADHHERRQEARIRKYDIPKPRQDRNLRTRAAVVVLSAHAREYNIDSRVWCG